MEADLKSCVAISMLLFVAVAVGAGEGPVGEIAYVEGNPEIIRDGDVVHDTVDFGFPVENFDSIRTDPFSSMELRLYGATGIDATIFVHPDTQFHLNVSSLRSEQTGSLELLAGTIGVVARELAGRSSLQVRTHSSVAGVRGTTFAVTTAVGGEVLISSQEGLVEVADAEGTSLFAGPGEAVEVDAERGLIRNVAYPPDSIQDFRRQWLDGRLEAFRANAPRALLYYGRLYARSRRRFEVAYETLMSHRDEIDRWIEESRRGLPGRERPPSGDRARLAAVLYQIRASTTTFEHAATRLEQMEPYVRALATAVALGDEADASSDTVGDLYDRMGAEREVIRRRLATVRRVMKLYSERNGGELPIAAASGDEGE